MNKVKKQVAAIANGMVDWTIDKVVSMVVSAKENKIDEMTFDQLVSTSKSLQLECDGDVAGAKCYVVFDKEELVYRIGVFPVDSKMRTFGEVGNPVMETFAALRLDAKLSSLMRNGNGKFMIPNK